MRVTLSSFPMSLVNQLGDLSTRQAKLQNQAATGQRIQNSSDDPNAVRQVMEKQTESRSIDQFVANIATQRDLGNVSYGVLKGLKSLSDKAGVIAISANGTTGQQDLDGFADQVDQLINQAADLMNSSFNGSYLYSGTMDQKKPFEVTRDPNGRPTAVSFNGNSSLRESEIAPGTTLSAGAVGANTSGVGPRGVITDSRSGADFFNHLIEMAANLRRGDKDALKSVDMVNLKKDEENIIYHYGLNGASQSRLESADSAHRDRHTALESQVSATVDADLAQTLVSLNETQNAYKAALQSAGTIMNMSLLDYLR